MSLVERPVEILVALTRKESSGELICASSTAEVHVYLQRGRIAWATDSEHPFAFTRYLQKTTQIDAESFRDILESCKRERRPLGETLVSWGAATPEEVRDALRHQVEVALEVLGTGGPAQTLFLDRTRQFSHYDSALTFDLGELMPSVCKDARVGAPPAPSVEPGPGSAAPSQYARRLLSSVEGLLWTELLESTHVIDAAPEAAREARFPREIIERTVLDGAQLVALRSPQGTLAGVALPSSRSLWCRLTADATVGAAVSALSAFGGTERRSGSDDSPLSRDSSAPWVGGAPEGPAGGELLAFLGRAPETLAAIATTADDSGWWCGAGSGSVRPEWAIDLVRRRARVLGAPRIFSETAMPRTEDDDGVGFRFRSMMSAERQAWCFGAELETRPRRTLWLLLDRRASQGIGWAYLTSLSRQLLHLRNWERHG